MIKTLPQLLLAIILFTLPLVSQIGETYSSWYGAFTITLPPDMGLSGFGGLTITDMGGSGDSNGMRWTGDGIDIEVHYIDLEKEQPPVTAAGVLERIENAIGALKSASSDDGFKLLHDRPVLANGNKGREILFEGSMTRSVFRYYATSTRFVRLQATFTIGSKEALAQKFLDSIKLTNRDEIAALKIKEATPAALPQQPPSNRAKPDSDLKGPVAKMVEEYQAVKDGEPQPVRKRTSETDYDRQGYTTRVVSYEYNGHPGNVIVFGYLDGMRVSLSGSIRNENIIRGIMPPRPGEVPKPRDERYTTRYEVKYDAQGRIQERSIYWNNGELGSRSVYSYSADQLVIHNYNDKNVLESKRTETLNAKGNIVRSIFERFGNYPGEYRTEYKYEINDKYGNWTKRSETTAYYEKGVLKRETGEIQYRRIVYWK